MPHVQTPDRLEPSHPHFEGAWTCMWCGEINVFMWDEEGVEFTTPITMLCSHCGGGTAMERNEDDKPTKKPEEIVLRGGPNPGIYRKVGE